MENLYHRTRKRDVRVCLVQLIIGEQFFTLARKAALPVDVKLFCLKQFFMVNEKYKITI
jgi:hypothetical protein